MVEAYRPARQQAHDLVEQLTPVQLSALIDLLGTVAIAATTSNLIAAPFSDEPLDDPQQRDGGLRSLDSDFWPAMRRPQRSYSAGARRPE